MSDPAAILRAFADLAPSGSRVTYDVVGGGEPFLWLGTRKGPLAVHLSELSSSRGRRFVPDDTATLKRLAAIDALYSNERLVREGWVFLCGRAEIDGETRQLCLPLVSVPVRVDTDAPVATRAGDRELLSLVGDPQRAAQLEDTIEFGGGALDPGIRNEEATQALVDRLPRLQHWIRDVVVAAGFKDVPVLGPEEDPRNHRVSAHLVAIVGSALYLARDPAASNLSSSLQNWAAQTRLGGTAFSKVYADTPPVPNGEPPVR
jgi:hypothetical protein